MKYPHLLLALEDQLQWLQKRSSHYLNIEALPQIALQELIDGLNCVTRPDFQGLQPKPLTSQAPAVSHPIPESMHSIFPPESAPLPPGFHRLKAQLAAHSSCSPSKATPQIPPQIQTSSASHSSSFHTSMKTKNSTAETLEALKALHASCQQCPLGKTRLTMVFGEGLSQARLMFVGEGPGAEEDVQGKPFVGRSGKLLTKMISSLGMTRPDVYIANIVKCRPPENRNPKPDEISSCIPILQRQMELINPDLIVTLGNVPTHALLPDTPGITKARGSLLEYQNWKVLPTFHPSYLLRNRNAMPLAWEDFHTIAEVLLHSK